MKLKVLGSGSAGNCYVLQASDGHMLLVEAGIRWADIKRGLDWRTALVDACTISHRHGDHALAFRDLLGGGIRCLVPQDVADTLPRPSTLVRVVQGMRGYKIGPWRLMPLEVQHDVPCMAYIIEHQEMGRTLFVTDTGRFPYELPSMNHVMIECNWSVAGLEWAIDHGITPPNTRERLQDSHMELGTTIRTLQGMDLSQANEIVLLHLSGRNGNPQEFKDKVRRATGLPVYVAGRGVEIDFSLTPY